MRVDGSGELEALRRAGASKPPERAEKKKPTRAAGSAAGAEPAPGESVEFSEIAKVLAKLANSPPMREEKVEEVRAEVERGEYVTRERLEGAIERLLGEI